jgi:hypothetical protein
MPRKPFCISWSTSGRHLKYGNPTGLNAEIIHFWNTNFSHSEKWIQVESFACKVYEKCGCLEKNENFVCKYSVKLVKCTWNVHKYPQRCYGWKSVLFQTDYGICIDIDCSLIQMLVNACVLANSICKMWYISILTDLRLHGALFWH